MKGSLGGAKGPSKTLMRKIKHVGSNNDTTNKEDTAVIAMRWDGDEANYHQNSVLVEVAVPMDHSNVWF